MIQQLEPSLVVQIPLLQMIYCGYVKAALLFIPDRVKKNKYLENYQLEATLFKQGANCYVRNGNVCWQDQTDSKTLSYIVLFLVFINVCLAIGWGISQWNGKRREMKSRMLVLQILTHELRTPIASLGLTVEGFRRQFEALPESLYDEFRRLCEDSSVYAN